MAFLIYKKANGKILQISEVSGAYTEEDTITTVFGVGGLNVFGALEWDGDFPVGSMVKDGVVIVDPLYVAPPLPLPTPEPIEEPTPTNTPTVTP